MADLKELTIRKILDAATTGDIIAARQALDDFAASRAVAFCKWADNTKAKDIPEPWETLDDLYVIFKDRSKV